MSSITIKNSLSYKVANKMVNRYTKGMSKKIDLTDLFNITEEDPLILNVEDMNFEERTVLFDKLYQDYILLLDEKKTSKLVKNTPVSSSTKKDCAKGSYQVTIV